MTNYIQRTLKSKDDVLGLGKFKGKTVGYVLINEPSYIMWLQTNKIICFPDGIVAEATQREMQRLGAAIRHANYGTGYMRQDS